MINILNKNRVETFNKYNFDYCNCLYFFGMSIVFYSVHAFDLKFGVVLENWCIILKNVTTLKTNNLIIIDEAFANICFAEFSLKLTYQL